MAKRSIEETFKTIAPSRVRGVPNPQTIGASFSTGGSDASSLSNATSEISQLRTAYQQQAQLITANTQALQSNAFGWKHDRQRGFRIFGRLAGAALADCFRNYESIRGRQFDSCAADDVYAPSADLHRRFSAAAKLRYDAERIAEGERFPTLKTGAVAQYPLQTGSRFASQAVQFLDGSRQLYRIQGPALRRWAIQLDNLDEGELAMVIAFSSSSVLRRFRSPIL